MEGLTRNPTLRAFLILSVFLLVSNSAMMGAMALGFSMAKDTSTSITSSSEIARRMALKWECKLDGCVDSSPAVGDVDGDGYLEVVVVSWDKNIYCLNAALGIKWQHSMNPQDPLNGVPVIVDINGDGKKEIIVAYLDSCVFCFGSYGNELWNYTTDGIFGPQPAGFEPYPPVVADLNGDGKLEIITGSTNNNTYCLDASGKLMWRYTAGDISPASPVVADVNNDGKLEVVSWSWDGYLYILDASGKLVSKMSYPPGVKNFIVTDINKDGKLDVVSEQSYIDISSFSLSDGTEEWTYSTGGGITSPVLADSNNDGTNEVVFGSYDNNVYCLSSSGSLIWSRQLSSYAQQAPAVADADNDGLEEVIIGTYGDTIFALRGADGALKYSTTLPESGFMTSPVIADLDQDGQKEVIIAVTSGGSGPSWIYSVKLDSVGTLPPQGGLPPGGMDMFLPPLALLIPVALVAVFAVLLVVGSVRMRRRANFKNESTSSEQQKRYVGRDRVLNQPVDIEGPAASLVETSPNLGAIADESVEEYGQSLGPSSHGATQEKQTSINQTCMVCGLPLEAGEGLLRCPHCGNSAHKVHMLEWLHVKNYCPICRVHLGENDFSRSSLKSVKKKRSLDASRDL